MNKLNHNKVYIRTGFIFIAIGLIGLGFPFLSFGFLNEYSFLTSLAQTKETEAQQATLNQQFIEPGAVISTPVPDYALKAVKNRLTISGIGIDMPIFQGDSATALWKGGWVFPGTSTPDKRGNTVIFGHRFRYLPPISNTFFSLNKVKVGDEFAISWQGKDYKYKVVEIKTIEPTDLAVLEQTAVSRVTLITCAPLFSTKQRLVVVGDLFE